MKWKVEIQIHWIECVSVDTIACRNEWNMQYVCPIVKHQWRFQSLTRTIFSLVLNICFIFWKKWALNRLQIYLRSDCMDYQCHIWRNTLITKLFLKLHYLGCFRFVYAQAWHPHNVFNRWNRKRKWGPGGNPRVDVVKMQQIAVVCAQGGRFIPGLANGLPGVSTGEKFLRALGDGAMASQITSLTIVNPTVYSGADQRKHQSSASLALVRGIHRWSVYSTHQGPVTRKMFPFDHVIMMVNVTNPH